MSLKRLFCLLLGVIFAAAVVPALALASPPSVETSPATAILPTTATLNGTLNRLGTTLSAEVSFEWGETTDYGSSTAPQTLHNAGNFSSAVSGLYGQHTYHFRAKAVGDGITYGDDMTFTTPYFLPPIVDTGDATEISSDSARLNGDLTWLGSTGFAVINYTVNVNFEWGTSPGSYSNKTAAQPMTATGVFYFDQGGLSPKTTYYFRAKAIGSSTAYGTEKEFTTAADDGGICSGGVSATPGASSEIPTVLVALGLLLGLGNWLARRGARREVKVRA